jgi:hypothetical protein
LFDLQNDPTEMNNIIAQKSSQKTIQKLKKELLDLAKQFKDQEAVEILEKEFQPTRI